MMNAWNIIDIEVLMAKLRPTRHLSLTKTSDFYYLTLEFFSSFPKIKAASASEAAAVAATSQLPAACFLSIPRPSIVESPRTILVVFLKFPFLFYMTDLIM